MKSCPFRLFRRFLRVWFALALCGYLVLPLAAERLTFGRALELALARSSGMGIARADEYRARQAYLETRNQYIPQVIFGSGLAKTWGFPMSIEGSAPSVFNINTQSFVYNPAQREFLRAARHEWTATSFLGRDRREQTILDTALAYSELDKALAKLVVLRQLSERAQKAEFITQQRVEEGVDSKLELAKAKLSGARVRMRIAAAQSEADLLRQQLSQLTGLDAAGIEPEIDSFPALPQANQADNTISRALQNSSTVRAADAQAQASMFRAKGEHRALYPAIDLAGSYGLFTRFNNYDQFFQKFQRHNSTLGVVIRVPFLNFSQRARAEAADAEAIRARDEADQARYKVSNETLKLQRSIAQLEAARDVADLEWQVAQGNAEMVQARLDSGQASLRDLENANVNVSDSYASLLDAQYELDRARLQLLRATGELEEWARRAR